MARLSEEHFKRTPLTPTPTLPTRRPSRFKEIFKPRFSLSPNANSSSNTLTKAPPPPSPSPQTTMTPGFETIGLLPKERTSPSPSSAVPTPQQQGTTSGAELAEELRDVGVPGGMHVHACFRDFDGAYAITEEGFRDKEGRPLTEYEADLGRAERADGGEGGDGGDGRGKGTDGGDGGVDGLFDGARAPERLDSRFAKDTHVNEEKSSSTRRPSASSISSSSPSQSICDYIDRQTNKAILEHERTHTHTPTQSTTLTLTLKLTPSLGPKVTTSTTKSIGPFKISDAHLAASTQSLILTAYILLFLGAALVGPKTFFLTLWRVGVLLAVYAGSGWYLGWGGDGVEDVLLAPVGWAVGGLGVEVEGEGEATHKFGVKG
ncbi:hypothetical protein P153DRAFT_401470 [Dothidotthia symphoricarpi CBS 119687]|uniref:Uncharacterized protein n=1 Tax=Dothidotthia symphoricarpi CBS 119687 TaxID=1392245 RepID=A0A6A5ZZZ6_9PLEO|nr:uncharacterized protein P153DRAFT_401470 [Dothidotthia symphoricarpi CBS 119687]KAF2123911.1 hypothetical protein P153DRAFT_401470 [Dothidotthia symphoricarpi CBS 119687]